MRLLVGLFIGLLLGVLVPIALLVSQDQSTVGNRPPVAAPNRADLTLLIHAPFLGATLGEQLQRGTAPIVWRDVRVDVDTGSVLLVSGTAEARGVRIPVSLRLGVIAQDRRLAIQMLGAQLGGLPVPPQFTAAIEDQMNQQLSRMLPNAPFDIVGVRSQPDALLIDVILRR